jgi:hypothetical protein
MAAARFRVRLTWSTKQKLQRARLVARLKQRRRHTARSPR